jgi:predicted MFS family arabinose efflux permease
VEPEPRPWLLLERDFALIWTAGLISMTGNLAMFVALPVTVYGRTGSPLATALTALAGLVPSVLVGQFAGVVADRVDRRRLLIVANLVMAALTGLYLAVPDGMWWPLVGLSLALGSAAQFGQSAEHALLGEIVPPHRLGEGASLNAMNNNLARLVGPAAGGFLYALAGFRGTVALDAVTFAIAATLVLLASKTRQFSPEPRIESTGWIADWVLGAGLVWSHQVLRPLVLLVALAMFGEGAISALLAPFAREVLRGGAEVLGLILATQAVGGIAGAWWASRTADHRAPLRMLGGASLTAGCLLIVIFNYAPIYPHPWPAVVLTGLAGFPFAVFGAAQGYALQVYAPPQLRGRVFSLAFGVLSLAQMVGTIVAGLAAERWGPLVINIDAVAHLGVGVIALVMTRTRLRGIRQ